MYKRKCGLKIKNKYRYCLTNDSTMILGSNFLKKSLALLVIILIAATPVMAFAETRDIEGNAIIGSA